MFNNYVILKYILSYLIKMHVFLVMYFLQLIGNLAMLGNLMDKQCKWILRLNADSKQFEYLRD